MTEASSFSLETWAFPEKRIDDFEWDTEGRKQDGTMIRYNVDGTEKKRVTFKDGKPVED